jgi:hypothetical protein
MGDGLRVNVPRSPGFGQFGNAFVELAFHEQRYSPAARLLGYARATWCRPDTQPRCAELLAALEAVLDPESLERWLPAARRLTKKPCVR